MRPSESTVPEGHCCLLVWTVNVCNVTKKPFRSSASAGAARTLWALSVPGGGLGCSDCRCGVAVCHSLLLSARRILV